MNRNVLIWNTVCSALLIHLLDFLSDDTHLLTVHRVLLVGYTNEQ